MVNNKEQGTHEDALIQSEVAFLKYKKPIIIAVIAIVVVVAGFFLYKNFVSGPREAEGSTELAKSLSLRVSNTTKLLPVSRRYKATTVGQMQAISLTFMLLFAMLIRLNQTGQRHWRTQRSSVPAMTR